MGMAYPERLPKAEPTRRCARHSLWRCRVGPTGNKAWTVLVDRCGYCGLLRPVKRPLSWAQRDWVRRMNRHIGFPATNSGKLA